jgi:hypothetical protein
LNLNSTIFWDITPCRPLSVNRCSGGTYRLHLQGVEKYVQQETSLFFRSQRWRRYVPPKRRLTLNGLHGVISQKIVLFTTTAVRTSNPKIESASAVWNSLINTDSKKLERSYGNACTLRVCYNRFFRNHNLYTYNYILDNLKLQIFSRHSVIWRHYLKGTFTAVLFPADQF